MSVQEMKEAMVKLADIAQKYSNEILRLQGEYRLLNDLIKIEEKKPVETEDTEEVPVVEVGVDEEAENDNG